MSELETITASDAPASRGPRRGPWFAAALIVIVVAGAVILANRDPSPSTGVAGANAQFPWEMNPPPRSLVPLEEIRSGGPPPDGIPPIDDPKFVSTAEAGEWIGDREPVLVLIHKGESRAYPLQILTWHEIVNDEIAGDPITVTYCPLCNSGIAFDRRVGGDVLDFGTSGRLYRSNLVMYDRQTKSLWIQFTGQAVAGPFIETELENVPVQISSWEEFRRVHPDGSVLSRETGHQRSYGTNPYAGYDDVGSTPFLFDGPDDDRLAAMERVVAVSLGEADRAYRYADLIEAASGGSAAVTDELGGEPIVVFYQRGTASALDAAQISSSRDIGATGVFRPQADGRTLVFRAVDGAIVDDQTGSAWSLLGEATAGPLQGQQLERVVFDDTFWFVWAVFRPGTTIWEGAR